MIFILLCAMLSGALAYKFAENSVGVRVALSQPCFASPENGGSYVYKVAQEEEAYSKRVYLGGQLIGFELKLNGVMIADFNEVDTSVGSAKLKSGLKTGDVIKSIDGIAVGSAEEIVEILNKDKGKSSFSVTVMRGEEKLEFTVNPLIERVSGDYKLGISVRSELGGIGTVTYIKQNGRFGALGHSVGGTECYEVSGGDACGCKIIGIEKGTRGRAGSIKGLLNKKERLGKVDKNIRYGIYGNLDEKTGTLYDVAKREEVTCGRAQLCSAISGKREFYDIEIVKTLNQESKEEKGMVIKVTDKRLIALTGGIVQGMSGSPIIQNNKIVGGLTHVFVNNPLNGYGVYLDFMLDN